MAVPYAIKGRQLLVSLPVSASVDLDVLRGFEPHVSQPYHNRYPHFRARLEGPPVSGAESRGPVFAAVGGCGRPLVVPADRFLLLSTHATVLTAFRLAILPLGIREPGLPGRLAAWAHALSRRRCALHDAHRQRLHSRSRARRAGGSAADRALRPPLGRPGRRAVGQRATRVAPGVHDPRAPSAASASAVRGSSIGSGPSRPPRRRRSRSPCCSSSC